MNCARCSATAIIDQPYRGQHLCEPHFRASVRERVRREMHRQVPRFHGGTIAVALSGGKDSAVALSMVHDYFHRRPTVRIVAITVDEGVAGYRSASIRSAQALTEQLQIEHSVVRAQDRLGVTTDQATERLPGTVPCSYCGVWRRQLLNGAAREVGADRLVLGFNLDDLAQTILMNLARADLDRLARMAPHRQRQPGLIPRIAPLATIPEREVFLYARTTHLPFDHGECPHAGQASRNVFRDVVWQLEEALPGTRHALLRTHERLAQLLLADQEAGAPGHCEVCGEPSTGPRCRACEYLELAHGRIMPSAGS